MKKAKSLVAAALACAILALTLCSCAGMEKKQSGLTGFWKLTERVEDDGETTSASRDNQDGRFQYLVLEADGTFTFIKLDLDDCLMFGGVWEGTDRKVTLDFREDAGNSDDWTVRITGDELTISDSDDGDIAITERSSEDEYNESVEYARSRA